MTLCGADSRRSQRRLVGGKGSACRRKKSIEFDLLTSLDPPSKVV